MFVCLNCNRTHDKHMDKCRCGEMYMVVDVPHAAFRPARSKFVRPSEITQRDIPYKKIKNFEFLGEVSKRFTMMIYGKPGSGKSTFALRFGVALGKTLYVSLEESLESATIQKRLRDEGIMDTERIVFVQPKKPTMSAIKKLYTESKQKNLIIDSLNVLGRPSAASLQKIIKLVSGIIIFIVHSTKDDGYKAGTEIEHEVDISLHAEREEKVVLIKKNRFHHADEKYFIFPDSEEDRKKKMMEMELMV